MNPTNPMKRSGQNLYLHAKSRIPGGTQLLSKRPEMFLPDNWPAYFSRVSGCTVWDLDGREYIDFTTCGVGSCLLGYADATVNAAVIERVTRGNMCMLNSPEEVMLADKLCSIHQWAEKVRYARGGGEAMAVAVRLARAATGRTTVAFCGYHGWTDWYLAANLAEKDELNGHLLPGLDPKGVPPALRGTALPFHYNRIAELEAIVSAQRGRLAAIVMEPMRMERPAPGFLERVRALADEAGAVLIFDEITSGWRSCYGGIHSRFGVNPDVAVFAKALSNGFPMAAVIGRGVILDAAQSTFVSSTYWTEGVGPTAALATLDKMQAVDVSAYVDGIGTRVLAGWKMLSGKHGFVLKVDGIPAICHFAFDEGESSRLLMTLFTQQMLERGYLANGSFYPTYAHQQMHVDLYLQSMDEVLGWMRVQVDRGELEKALRGPVAHSGFTRLT